MPLSMFRLAPGEATRFEIHLVQRPTATGLLLCATRPREGRSVDLLLELLGRDGLALSQGRVPIDRGYLSILCELRRQLRLAGELKEGDQFELRRVVDERRAVATHQGRG